MLPVYSHHAVNGEFDTALYEVANWSACLKLCCVCEPINGHYCKQSGSESIKARLSNEFIPSPVACPAKT